ncbi:MAG TPA: hypothetical protein DF296_10440 [Candidatus Margulisbacteria bacterium]|nr:MAG: hypothetical protein A2X43_00970 [Candidatus Margulisbacteria bacterium GWD2_39_127]OGI02401.1 MAG: hypothetical protein A2X42_09620 [Candidatus Margulisbacteria bacterium GWF2_38_17]OGI08533.1 MAG: hypothetical protein A2X41_07405 [Candidatus Margulisbacteria bacterium GWE2_39_32]HAR63444.1 hypothetical protein [Candidatus Margulisiibacteriota bacterium]HCT85602.1 hypothetical protein [Candidatus Margulisiibacteriota bacterium]
MNRKKIVMIVGLLFLFLSPYQAKAENLRSLIAKAVKNNFIMKASRETIEKADYEIEAVQKQYLPSVIIDSSYRYISEVPSIALPPRKIETGVNNNYELGIGTSYLLFNGYSREATIQLKHLQKQVAEVQLKKNEKDIAFNVAKVYMNSNVLLAQKEIINAVKERVNNHVQKIRALINQGMALVTDELTLKLSISRYEQQLVEINSNISNNLDQLKSMVGEPVTISATSKYMTDMNASTLNLAEKEEIKTYLIKKQVSEANQIINKSKDYPDISLSATYKYAKPGVNPIDNEWMGYYSVGAGIRWNLWDSGTSKANVNAQNKEMAVLDYQEQHSRDQIQLAYDATVRESKTMLKQLDYLKESASLARTKMELVRNQADRGFSTLTDVNAANNEFTEAELLLEQHKVKISLKVIEIDYLSGMPISEWRLN